MRPFPSRGLSPAHPWAAEAQTGGGLTTRLPEPPFLPAAGGACVKSPEATAAQSRRPAAGAVATRLPIKPEEGEGPLCRRRATDSVSCAWAKPSRARPSAPCVLTALCAPAAAFRWPVARPHPAVPRCRAAHLQRREHHSNAPLRAGGGGRGRLGQAPHSPEGCWQRAIWGGRAQRDQARRPGTPNAMPTRPIFRKSAAADHPQVPQANQRFLARQGARAAWRAPDLGTAGGGAAAQAGAGTRPVLQARLPVNRCTRPKDKTDGGRSSIAPASGDVGCAVATQPRSAGRGARAAAAGSLGRLAPLVR